MHQIMNILSKNYYHWMLSEFKNHYDGTVVGIQHETNPNYNSLVRIVNSFEILYRAGAIHYNPIIFDESKEALEHFKDLLDQKITRYALFCEEELIKWLE